MRVQSVLSIGSTIVTFHKKIGLIDVYFDGELTFFYVKDDELLFAQEIKIEEGAYGGYFDGCDFVSGKEWK